MTTQKFEVVFIADAEYTAGPTYEAQQAAEAEQEVSEGEEPDPTSEETSP